MDDVGVNPFLVQVAVIFLPGIIWARTNQLDESRVAADD